MAWILDLDGALLDSEPWHKRAEMETFAELGVEISIAELHRFTGTTMDFMVRDLGCSLDDFLALHRPRLLGYVHGPMQLHNDVLRFLARVNSSMALATNSMRWYVQPAITRFFPEFSFAAVVCADDVENGKPSPDSFLRAAQLMGVAASDCVALEDSMTGVIAAKAAGCRVIAVQRDPRIELSDADLVVTSLDDLDPTTIEELTNPSTSATNAASLNQTQP